MTATKNETSPPGPDWRQISAHDTAEACERARVALRAGTFARKLWSVLGYDMGPQLAKAQQEAARCIPAESIYPPKQGT